MNVCGNVAQRRYCRILSFFLAASLVLFPFARLHAEPGDNTAEIRVLLVAYMETTLSGQLAAQIKHLAVKNGNRFNRGDVLVAFDCRLNQARLESAKAALQGAQKTHEANLRLKKFEAVSELEVAISEAELLRAEAEFRLNQVQNSLCEIKAPFSGRVTAVRTAPYASVSPGEPLLDILDDSKLEVQLHIPSRWLTWIKKGTQFKLRIDETGHTYEAEVIRPGAKVDPVSQTLEIMAKVINKDKHLLAGMSGVAYFEQPGN